MATVEDLASRRLPGSALGEHHDAALAKAALCMAAAVRGGDVGELVVAKEQPVRRASATSCTGVVPNRLRDAGICHLISSGRLLRGILGQAEVAQDLRQTGWDRVISVAGMFRPSQKTDQQEQAPQVDLPEPS